MSSLRKPRFATPCPSMFLRPAAALALGASVMNGCGGDEPPGRVEADAAAYCSDLYDDGRVPVFELEFAAEELAGLESDCNSNTKRYRPVTFKYGTETVAAMVRIKGNWSWRCDKKQYLISFNETDSKGRFHGLRKIVLDAAWYDPTLLAERLGASFMGRTGVPSSCVNNAQLFVNGEYYGVYANVERLDKEYLQRHFRGDDANGNLYDGGQELRTNEDVSDVSRRDALFAASGSLPDLERLAELEQAVKVWAGLAMLPDVDSYWAGVEINYFLYDHPTRGFLWLPYDMDMTAPTGEFDAGASSVNIALVERYVQASPFTYENPDWGKEQLFRTVLSDPGWCGKFLEQLSNALGVYDVNLMTRDLDRWAAQISEAVDADPHKPFTSSEHAAALATMKRFLSARRDYVAAWLETAQCPVTHW